MILEGGGVVLGDFIMWKKENKEGIYFLFLGNFCKRDKNKFGYRFYYFSWEV